MCSSGIVLRQDYLDSVSPIISVCQGADLKPGSPCHTPGPSAIDCKVPEGRALVIFTCILLFLLVARCYADVDT